MEEKKQSGLSRRNRFISLSAVFSLLIAFLLSTDYGGMSNMGIKGYIVSFLAGAFVALMAEYGKEINAIR